MAFSWLCIIIYEGKKKSLDSAHEVFRKELKGAAFTFGISDRYCIPI